MKDVNRIRIGYSSVSTVIALALTACANDRPAEPSPDAGTPLLAPGGQTGNPPVGTGEFAGGAPNGGTSYGGAPSTGGVFAGGGLSGAPGTGGALEAGGAPEITPLGCSPDAGPTEAPGITGTVKLCPCAKPVSIPFQSLAPCKMTGCSNAHCVPTNLIPPSAPIDLLGSCDESTKCVPDDYVITFAQFLAKKCTSLGGAEGRCISTCIPQVNGLMDALPVDVCDQTERCAPCINPNDGTDTHACNVGCDTGPAPGAAPVLFTQCAGGRGRCVPSSIVPAALVPNVPVDSCTQPGYVCAPLEKTQDIKHNFQACTPCNGFVQVLATPGPNGQKGGCVPPYLANFIEGVFLAQDNCPSGDLCAPCNNPLTLDQPTGACPVPLVSDPSGGEPPAPESRVTCPAAPGAGGAPVGTGGAPSGGTGGAAASISGGGALP